MDYRLLLTRRFLPLLLASIAATSLLPELSAKRFSIIINAEAEGDYVKKSEKLAYQTYHFVKGDYYSGDIRDTGLEDVAFDEIASSIATALRKRAYYPEPDKMLGDLLIMITWGRTSVDADYRKEMGVMNNGEMGGATPQAPGAVSGRMADADIHGGLGEMSPASQNDVGGDTIHGTRKTSQKGKNIALLGLEKELERSLDGYLSSDDLLDALDEDRYFIVLNAFDYQHLLEYHELEQVWSARYSTRATGIGFKTAYESMNDAVSGVLGLNVEKLGKVKGDTSSSSKQGEIEVIGYEGLKEK